MLAGRDLVSRPRDPRRHVIEGGLELQVPEPVLLREPAQEQEGGVELEVELMGEQTRVVRVLRRTQLVDYVDVGVRPSPPG